MSNGMSRTWADVRDDPRLEAFTIQIDAFGATTHTTWVRAQVTDGHWRRVLSIAQGGPGEPGTSRVVSAVVAGEPVTVTETDRARRLVIRSGGQTGVDRAALDAAIACDLTYTGFVPKGGLCEDGMDLLAAYPHLVEMDRVDYPARTIANVQAADATLVISPANKPLGKGTALTVRAAERAGKPHLLLQRQSVSTVLTWLDGIDTDPLELNVAGPRESGAPGIYAAALPFLTRLFTEFTGTDRGVR